jgi:hypothetical protein
VLSTDITASLKTTIPVRNRFTPGSVVLVKPGFRMTFTSPDYLREQSGKKFDPNIVEVFVRMMTAG